MRILYPAAMREADRLAIQTYGIPALRLMEQAARQVFTAVEEMAASLGLALADMKVVLLAGPGNNGGDAWALARMLRMHNTREVTVVAADDDGTHAMSPETRENRQQTIRLGGISVISYPGTASREGMAAGDSVERVLQHCHLVVDGLYGTGFRGEVTEPAISLVSAVNRSRKKVISIDVPSGLDAATGMPGGICIRADVTVTFGCPKPGLLIHPGCTWAGRVRTVDIGLPEEALRQAEALQPRPSPLSLADRDMVAGMLPLRKDDSHKGDYGRLLIVAGSAGMAGAACLCARSALRSGAGLVYEAGPATIMPVVSVYVPEAIFLTYPGDVGEEDPCRVAAVLVEACHPDGLVIGPGLPAGGKTAALVKALLTALPPQTRLVLDAGALQSLTSTGELAELRQYAGRRSSEQAPILTPHPGEMARLLGCAVADVQRDRMTAAMRLADLTGAVTVLKGSRTLVAMPDGRLCINPTGNPGMATAGAGDVLAGIIGGLAVQGMSAWETAVAGVYLHGLAGDIAARKKGLHGLMAGDLTETLPAAFLNTLNGDEHHEV